MNWRTVALALSLFACATSSYGQVASYKGRQVTPIPDGCQQLLSNKNVMAALCKGDARGQQSYVRLWLMDRQPGLPITIADDVPVPVSKEVLRLAEERLLVPFEPMQPEGGCEPRNGIPPTVSKGAKGPYVLATLVVDEQNNSSVENISAAWYVDEVAQRLFPISASSVSCVVIGDGD